jgi:myxalamid-type polyketide synthase MxaE and MxaD
VGALFEELWSDPAEADLAFRQGERYVARLRRYADEAAGTRAGGSSSVAPFELRPDGTYLVTGGLGGLGLAVARWMVEQGARHLVLVGRRGAVGDARDAVGGLEQAGAHVVVASADVSREADVARVLAAVKASMPPLRGVIHAAAVLDDGVLTQQTQERFGSVMRSKVPGTCTARPGRSRLISSCSFPP